MYCVIYDHATISGISKKHIIAIKTIYLCLFQQKVHRPRLLLGHQQGLTQTFMSSGPQDHQLRGSGGPTIFSVVLTTTNVITLGNLEFFSRLRCVSTSLVCKTTKGMTRDSSRPS